ncbi:TPA: AAA family ATPase [Vibrio parahaemolyticus]|nr:AAA family ATPase [Vibrio parahaemolyticus]
MSDSNLPKFVREKIRLADNGDLYSCYTVANYYIDKKTLDVNEEKSNHYFSLVSDKINNVNFRVKELSVFDYKRFSKAHLTFPDKGTTVVIGNNGSGKSTILEAIAKNLQFLSDNIRIKNNNNYKFHESEINVDAKYDNSTIECIIELDNKYSFSCSLVKNSENTPRKITSELEQFKALGGMLQESDRLHKDNFSYPLLAYYPVERSVTVKREEVTRKQEKQDKPLKRSILDKIEGHNKPFDGTSNFDTFFNWFKEIDDIVNEYKASTSFTPEDIKNALINRKPEQSIEDFLSSFIISDEDTDEDYKIALKNQIEIVKKAIKKFLSDIEEIAIRRTPYLDMYVTKRGKKLSVFHLSQGEKTLLALVSDIARRLVTLNPKLDEPLHGRGIVIIDELDLHLHPQWQQSVIQNLEETFPNIQFIVSTHSPLILNTVTSEKIKILDENSTDGTLLTPEINPFGKVSAEALAIMDTPEKPSLKLDIEDKLNEFEQLVKSGKENEPDTKKLKSLIEATGYTIDDSQLELWRFISQNSDLFDNTSGEEEA